MKKPSGYDINVTELTTPVDMHLMSDIREAVQGYEAVHAQRPLRVELSETLYKIFRFELQTPQMSADQQGNDEVKGLRFSGVPVVRGDYDGIRLCR